MTTIPDDRDGRAVAHPALTERGAAKVTPPLFDPDSFAAAGLFESDEEVDEFIAAVRRWRNEDY